jgi:hypothetical protein
VPRDRDRNGLSLNCYIADDLAAALEHYLSLCRSRGRPQTQRLTVEAALRQYLRSQSTSSSGSAASTPSDV